MSASNYYIFCPLFAKYGVVQACEAVASMKGIQTLDLSSNQLSLAGAEALAKALWRCRSLHEIVLEESIASEEDAKKVCYVHTGEFEVGGGVVGRTWSGEGGESHLRKEERKGWKEGIAGWQ